MLDLNKFKQDFPKIEEEVLAFWKENDIFQKSMENRKDAEPFTFYDGPPFATGLPHYGHILAGTIKDVIPRYQTMKGKFVARRFGWDCHGLPVEYEMEKELGLSGRQDIEKYGIKNFCESCRGIVQRYTSEWETTVERMGRWVDFKNDYKTMDASYMESIMWVFKSLHDKGLIYEDYKPMHICPRCATTLSNFEVSMGYKDVDDLSVVAKFKLKDEENTFVLAWTTTPWTLPANILLAVGAEVDYVKVAQMNTRGKLENLILAKSIYENKDGYIRKKLDELGGCVELGEHDCPPSPFKIIAEFKGKDLVGKSYQPLFEVKTDEGEKYKIVSADFVSTEDGTGVVHIAPAFGEDDLRTGREHNAPFFRPVSIDGKFTQEAPKFLQGKEVRASNKEIVKHLKEKNLVFEDKWFNHSYPHCWRCDSALLNYTTSSFFVNIGKIKDKMIANNQDIHWTPENLKDGRFGKWLDGARDWAISRNRFWGAPIPIWKCVDCEKTRVVGSVREIANNAIKKGKIMIARHGEGEHNVKNILSTEIGAGHLLTEKGIAQAQNLGETLKNNQIDIVYSSPLERTRQTTEEILKSAGQNPEVIFDERIRELEAGKMEGKSIKEWLGQFKNEEERFHANPHDGETKADVEKRTKDFLKEIYEKHGDKNILIVTHGAVLRMATKFFHNLSDIESLTTQIEHCTINEFSFSSLPTNDFGELDLHRPYIDEIEFACECGGKMNRVSDVLDCWFESGSMPYAERHYPFENKGVNPAIHCGDIPKEYPADFIAEGLDQTRGWFYTLHVLASGLFDTKAFKNVIVNGIVLAEDGRKMSKSLKNYPDPNLMFQKYGADAIRFYLMNSPVVHADDLRFAEQGVAETVRKVLLPLKNSYAFFASLSNITDWKMSGKKPQGKLNRWIIAELHESLKKITESMDNYDLSGAAREFPEFLDKLTNFYIRRSKRKFWEEDAESFETLYTVLTEISKALAPFCPLFTEALYGELVTINPEKSVPQSIHLCDWTDYRKFNDDKDLREEIEAVRTIISLGLAIRAKEKIRVRQPLQKIRIALPPRVAENIIHDNIGLIKEELNIKEIEILAQPEDIAEKIAMVNARKVGPRLGKEVQNVIRSAKEGNFSENPDGTIQVGEYTLNADEVEIAYLGAEGENVESSQGIVLALDTHISAELKDEGVMREIVRHIQDMRKEADYQISDRIIVAISGANEVVQKFTEHIKKEVLANEILPTLPENDGQKTVEIEGEKVDISIRKA